MTAPRSNGGASSAAAHGSSPNWDVTGPADGPVVLFVHGTRVTRDMWHPQIRAFADEYRMVSLDLPAHGSLKHVPFLLRHAKDEVRRAIDAACGGRAIVVGQSMGGYLAMLVASEHPDAVAGLVLSNCSTEPRTVARHATGTVWSYLRMAIRQRVKGHVPGPEEWPADDEVREPRVFEPATDGLLFRGSSRALASLVRTRFLPHLAAYPGSTLIVNGENDRVFRRSEHEFIAACRDGRLVVVEGAGHLVNIEGAEAFNAALRRFVDAVVAGRSVGVSAPGPHRGERPLFQGFQPGEGAASGTVDSNDGVAGSDGADPALAGA